MKRSLVSIQPIKIFNILNLLCLFNSDNRIIAMCGRPAICTPIGSGAEDKELGDNVPTQPIHLTYSLDGFLLPFSYFPSLYQGRDTKKISLLKHCEKVHIYFHRQQEVKILSSQTDIQILLHCTLLVGSKFLVCSVPCLDSVVFCMINIKFEF